ncbi:MAG: spermidine synthase, partial [Bryobacteraceae bacterium]
TGPLLQAWLAGAGHAPYRLFALSNLGSMLALLSYPTLVEPALGGRMQAAVWQGLYALFAVVCGAIAWRARGSAPWSRPEGEGAARPRGVFALWTLLAMCASTLLLAVTNHLCQDVASIPFLWILPLSVYLLTFIVCFERERWYRRWVFLPLLALALATLATLARREDPQTLKTLLPAAASALFICCMVCHGELVRLKPHARYLTSFYLATALGGALGGVFVGLAAPLAFTRFLELPIAIAACAALVTVVMLRDGRRLAAAACGVATVGLAVWASRPAREAGLTIRSEERNFYGRLRIGDMGVGKASRRTMINGATNHGGQFLDKVLRRLPTTYFGLHSGIGMTLLRKEPKRVGVIGLGAGTLAAYGRPGDYYRFYELNPRVAIQAYRAFTYMQESAAKTDVVLGDARLRLEQEESQTFDVLVLDAFSSDSIPVHLLTREAFATYFRHLKPEGILAVHITNQHLNLTPVVHRIASSHGKQSVRVTNKEEPQNGVLAAVWLLVAADTKYLPGALDTAPMPSMKLRTQERVWTDDYSNLFGTLR